MTQWKNGFDARSCEENIVLATEIADKYIGDSASEAKINVSSKSAKKVREGIRLASVVGDQKDIFDEAREQIEEIIYRDIFPRFILRAQLMIESARSRALALWFLHLDKIHSISDFFFFPPIINEAESRLHQYVVAVQMITFLFLGWFTPYWYPYIYIVYGYFVRIIAGPKLCPNAWIVLFVLYPIVNKFHLIENEIVPSAPKRFAQCIGLLFATTYVALMAVQQPLSARIVALIHISVSLLAGVTGFCVGCYTYNLGHTFYRNFRKTKNASLVPSVRIRPSSSSAEPSMVGTLVQPIVETTSTKSNLKLKNSAVHPTTDDDTKRLGTNKVEANGVTPFAYRKAEISDIETGLRRGSLTGVHATVFNAPMLSGMTCANAPMLSICVKEDDFPEA
jgi:hypothetical protein